MFDLRSYTSVSSTLLITWEVPGLSTAYITDYSSSISMNGNTYTNIGKLLSVSNTTSELKTSPNDLTISLSGVPTGSITDILNQQIKGSKVTIHRAFWNPSTGANLVLTGGGNTVMKFKGIVTNYSISDMIDITAQLATSTITLTCSSMVEVLSNKISGRRTNPVDFPGESSMSRVQALANSNFNFGAPE